MHTKILPYLLILSLLFQSCDWNEREQSISGGLANSEGTPYGASVPWNTLEAEEQITNAVLVEASTEYYTPAAESSYRSYVRLEKVGDYLEFKLASEANRILIRYCIPDGLKGEGMKSTLSLFVNDKKVERFRLDSKYAWVYGNYPWSNHPNEKKAHKFYDESYLVLKDIKIGDRIRIQKDEGDTADYYIIDHIDLELAPEPLERPQNSISVVDYGAIPNDNKEDSLAFNTCIREASKLGKTVWIPPGTYDLLEKEIQLPSVEIQGSGMWYTRLRGKNARFIGTGEQFIVRDLQMLGDFNRRVDTAVDTDAFRGNLGNGSLIERVWIEHYKCGIWTTNGTENLIVRNSRIRNTMADGINLCDGTSHSRVENNHFRNTGDDAIATWSPTGEWSSKLPCVANQIINNSIETPWLANGIGIYGGHNHVVRGNFVKDTVFSGAGLLISSGFASVPFLGVIEVQDNYFVRCGGNAYIGDTVGALWVHAKESDINAEIKISNMKIESPLNSAITIHGPKRIDFMLLDSIMISDSPEHAVHFKKTASGNFTINPLSLSNITKEPIQNDGASSVELLMGPSENRL